MMVRGRRRARPQVSFDINPTLAQMLEDLISEGLIADLIHAGRPAAPGRLQRLHRHGPGAGDARAQPAHGSPQLPRPLGHARGQGLPGQSGDGDRLGPHRRDHRSAHARHALSAPSADPDDPLVDRRDARCRRSRSKRRKVAAEKGPNIVSLPKFEPLPDTIEVPVLLKVGDDVSTDEIMPAGARVLPFRSNIPTIAEFAFESIDPT